MLKSFMCRALREFSPRQDHVTEVEELPEPVATTLTVTELEAVCGGRMINPQPLPP